MGDTDHSGKGTPAGVERAQEIERLFRDHNESLVSFLALRLRSRHEAHEVAQEAYVRLLQLERQDTSSFLRAYLFRIAGNLAIDRLRRRVTESRWSGAQLFEDLYGADEPERQALAREQMHMVREFLEEVPEQPRRAFLMFRVEEISQQVIAERLGVSDRMVRNYVTRVMVYCRLRMDGLDRVQAGQHVKWSAA